MVKIKFIPYILLVIIFILLAWIDVGWSDLSILGMKSMDEYVFHYSLLRMHEGVLNFELQQIFSYVFYSYGFLFFLTNLVVAFPFLADAGSNMSIILPRIVTSTFAIITLFYLLKILQLQKANILEQVILLFLIVLMPGFLIHAAWFNPNYMMAAFLCASIYYLSLDNNQYGKHFWIGIILWVFAVAAAKIQAITFAPVLLGMIIWKLYKREMNFYTAFRLISITGIIILVIFVVTNPYIIHPLGTKVWWNAFENNMLSNVTNHGALGNVTLWQKLSGAVGNSYLSMPLFALMLLSAVWFIIKEWQSKQLTANSLIAFYVLANLIYLLFAVNKAWDSYYLAPLLMGTILIISAIKQIRVIPKTLVISWILLFSVIIIQSYSFGGSLVERIALRLNDNRENELLMLSHENTNFIKSYIDADTVLGASPKIVFDYVSLGLKYNQVRLINGPLREKFFEEQNKYNSKVYKLLFRPANLILIMKDDIYFNEKRLSLRRDQKGYQHAKQLIERWKTGQGKFRLVAHNSKLLIFKRVK